VNEVRDNRERSRYELVRDGEVVAFVQYVMRGGRLILVHTEVADALSGHGLATELIAGTLDDVRVRAIPMVPVCEFVERFIERHPEYDDLVDHEMFDALNADKAEKRAKQK
jgi:predicted GNAT family acetyltransferase